MMGLDSALDREIEEHARGEFVERDYCAHCEEETELMGVENPMYRPSIPSCGDCFRSYGEITLDAMDLDLTHFQERILELEENK